MTPFKTQGLQAKSYDELVDALSKHAFFEFMERGRQGFNFAAEDIVEASHAFLQKTLQTEHVLSNSDREKVVQNTIQWLMDGFVTKGSAGLRESLHFTYQQLYDVQRAHEACGPML